MGKLALVQAGLSAETWVVTGVSLVVGVFTLDSMTKTSANVLGEPAPPFVSAAISAAASLLTVPVA